MKNIKKKHIIWGVVTLFLVILLTSGFILYRRLSATMLGGSTTCYVYVDGNDTADSVYSKLKAIATERGMSGFRLLAGYYGYADHVQTGQYAIEPGQPAYQVFRRLYGGQQTPVKLTIPEVRTMDAMAGRLSRKLMLDSASIAQALSREDFCRQYGYDTCTIACIFVPNTYEVYWNTSLDAFMQRMQREHDHFWNSERRQKAEALGLTPNEVTTLASLVDEETSKNQEKATIAGLYLNRLKRGMRLEADPTLKFAMKDFMLKRIYNRHKEVDSPYNTYKNYGLMPGPIRVPSVVAIDAVLSPEHHDYIFMCAKEDFSGTHNFAATLAEHEQNRLRYIKALDEREIK